MKIVLYFIVCLMIAGVFVGCEYESNDITTEEQYEASQEISKLIGNQEYDEAREKVEKYFSDDPDELDTRLGFIDAVEEHENRQSSQPSQKLEIQDNHNYEVRNNYAYITGRVKNVSDSEIGYFEIRVDFEDETGQVLDSTYTNDRLNLRPNEQREFEIMQRHQDEYETYRLSIEEVR